MINEFRGDVDTGVYHTKTGRLGFVVEGRLRPLEPFFFELFLECRIKELTTNILPPVSS